MKILHVVPYFPPDRVGGVGTAARRLHDELVARGHESEVLTRGESKEPHVHRIAKGRFGWFVELPFWAGRASAFDVVSFHGGEPLPLILALRCRRRRPKIVTVFHTSYRGLNASLVPYRVGTRRFAAGPRARLSRWVFGTLRRVLDAWAQRLSDHLVATSRACADELFRKTSVPSSVIRVGVSTRPDGPTQSRSPVDLLYVGVANHAKRVHLLPEILENVRRRRPRATLRIVGFHLGREPELASLFEERHLIDCVESVGEEAPWSLGPYFRSAGVLVLPSAHEGLPLAAVEAMAHGLPVVSTRVGGLSELIEDGKSGYLVPAGDTEALAERSLRVLQSPDERQRMARNARARVAENFALEREVDDYLSVFESSR